MSSHVPAISLTPNELFVTYLTSSLLHVRSLQPPASYFFNLSTTGCNLFRLLFQPEDCLSTYSTPHAYCIVYSTSDRSSFQQAEQSLQTLWKNDAIRSKAVILVANKTDLVRSRVVSTQGKHDIQTISQLHQCLAEDILLFQETPTVVSWYPITLKPI